MDGYSRIERASGSSEVIRMLWVLEMHMPSLADGKGLLGSWGQCPKQGCPGLEGLRIQAGSRVMESQQEKAPRCPRLLLVAQGESYNVASP